MKKLIIAFLLCASMASAQTNVQWCLEFMTTNYPGSMWTLQDDSNGKGVYIRFWSSAMPQPTMSQVYSNWALASVWKSNQVAEAKSDIENWKDKPVEGETMADAIKALIICINKRLPATNKITAVEYKTELKGQMQ